jgi:RNA ligase (TIGR02306 family)
MLYGPNKNRVKAISLRKELSQGLVWIPRAGWLEWFAKYYPEFQVADNNATLEEGLVGCDITSKIGVEKYHPAIPTHLSGIMRTAPDWMKPTDSENVKKVGRSLVEGEVVFITEKIHGTQMSCAFDGTTYYVASKGVLARGAVIEEAAGNGYWNCFNAEDLNVYLAKLYGYFGATCPVQILGEAYGSVQDLTYGNPAGPLKFRAFDIRVDGKFLDAQQFFDVCDDIGLSTVPLLYHGLYHVEKLKQLTDGWETVSGKQLHIREGVVVKPAINRSERWGRVSIKSVSEHYLTRKGNTTELE